MACKILVAIDESKSSLKAIRYVAETMKCEVEITLLSILPDAIGACGLEGPSLIPLFKENRKAFCSIEDAKRENVQTFINQAKEALIMAGFSPENVKLKIRKKEKGIAQDIMKEARDGGYDSIVVGRRGLSGLKEFFMGSVSNKVVHSAGDMAVIVVD